MVTERHQKQPQMRGIGSNEAASRIDTRNHLSSLQNLPMQLCALETHIRIS